MTLHLTVPKISHIDFVPKITVIGVGGGGTNAVDNMIALNLQGVDFVVANTDAQQLQHSRADRRIQLGPHITQGLGAGAKPEIGRAAAEEAEDEIYRCLDNTHMVFITAGMGGGTGTGAAPVIARMARERNILTVGVVTKPFTFEGARRARAADAGIEDLQQYVDTLIVIPNQNLFRLANEKTGWGEAFKMADHVLYMGVRGVTDLVVTPGLVNLDFADIRAVMGEMGKAMMGTGEAEGDKRAIMASEAAINNPLLEDTSMSGARGLLVNVTGGEDMTLFEVDQAVNRIREEVDEDANIFFGSAIDPNLEGKIRVSVVATGIDSSQHLHLVAGTSVPAQLSEQIYAVGGGGNLGGGHPQPPATGFGANRQAPRGFGPAPAHLGQSHAEPAHGHAQAAPAATPTAATVHALPMRPSPVERAQPGHAADAPAEHISQAPPPAQAAPRGGLFGEPPQNQQRPGAPAPAPASRGLFRSIFGSSQPAPRQEPDRQNLEPRASVQRSTIEDGPYEIPAFLRRQTASDSHNT